MKKIQVLAFSIILIMTACKKYEEGPAISFRSKDERLANTWVMSQVLETPSGGSKTDKTAEYNNVYFNFVLVMEKTNDYSVTYRYLNATAAEETGRWHFGSKKNILICITETGNSSTMEGKWTILRLKENELWMETVNSNNAMVEVHFKPR